MVESSSPRARGPARSSVLDQVGKHIAHQASASPLPRMRAPADRHPFDRRSMTRLLSERGGRGFHLVCFALTDRKVEGTSKRCACPHVAGLLHALVGSARALHA